MGDTADRWLDTCTLRKIGNSGIVWYDKICDKRALYLVTYKHNVQGTACLHHAVKATLFSKDYDFMPIRDAREDEEY